MLQGTEQDVPTAITACVVFMRAANCSWVRPARVRATINAVIYPTPMEHHPNPAPTNRALPCTNTLHQHKLGPFRKIATITKAKSDKYLREKPTGAMNSLGAHLEQLSPLTILDRGYAIVEHNGQIIKDAESAPPGTNISVRLAKGRLDGLVTKKLDSKSDRSQTIQGGE